MTQVDADMFDEEQEEADFLAELTAAEEEEFTLAQEADATKKPKTAKK